MSSSDRDRRGSFSRDREERSRRRFGRGGSNYRRSDWRDDLDHRGRYERRLRRVGSRSPSGRRVRRHERSPRREGFYGDDGYHSGSSTERSRSPRRRKGSISPRRRTSRYAERRGRYRDLPRRSRRRRVSRRESSPSDCSSVRSEYDSPDTEVDRRRRRGRAGRERSSRWRVGEKVEFKYRSKSGKMWLPAEVLEVEEGMYGELIYKIYLPDMKELMHYVSAEELRVRRRLTEYDFVQEKKDVRLFKNARRQHALEELWMDEYPKLVASRRDEYDRGRSRGRVRDMRSRSQAPLRASSAVRQNDLLEMAAVGVPKNKPRASSLPPARYTWPRLLAEFALHYNSPARVVQVTDDQDENEHKVLDDNEGYNESMQHVKPPVQVSRGYAHDNSDHLNIKEHDHEVQQNKRTRERFGRPYDHANDGDQLEVPSVERGGKGNPANLDFLRGDMKDGLLAHEGPFNFNFLFTNKRSAVSTQRWE